MIKAVFIDIDETLTNSKKEITKETKEAIKNCINKDIKIILTSGRARKEAMEFANKMNTSPYIISSNGASCYDVLYKKEIYNEFLSKETLLSLLNYAFENDFIIKLNYKDKILFNKTSRLDELGKESSFSNLENLIKNEDIVQCVMLNSDIDKMISFKSYIKENFKDTIIANESKRLTNLNLEPRNHYYCDITSKNVSKGNAVLELCKYLNLKNNEIITIGDGENDISMLKVTPNSVAMGNANSFVKSFANYVTVSNDDNGVAKVLNSL